MSATRDKKIPSFKLGSLHPFLVQCFIPIKCGNARNIINTMVDFEKNSLHIFLSIIKDSLDHTETLLHTPKNKKAL